MMKVDLYISLAQSLSGKSKEFTILVNNGGLTVQFRPQFFNGAFKQFSSFYSGISRFLSIGSIHHLALSLILNTLRSFTQHTITIIEFYIVGLIAAIQIGYLNNISDMPAKRGAFGYVPIMKTASGVIII